jgi:hypothetical protein
MTNSIYKRTFISLVCILTINSNCKLQTTLIWGKQYGSDKDEYSMNHVTDQKGNIYLSGRTTGVIADKNFGKTDGFLTKIDSSGKVLWSRQFGTAEEDDVQWSAIDNSGNIYLTGSTMGAMDKMNFGKEDLFIVKYNQDGLLVWTKQFGTDSTDVGKGIYVDDKGNIYITGYTLGKLGESSFGKTDAFLLKLDPEGNLIFCHQFGTPTDDYSYAITGSNLSGIFVCGSTWGDIGGKNKGFIDGFIGQFTTLGKPVKYTQFGSEGFDIAMNLILDDENNIYVGGSTSGDYAAKQKGEGDCFLLKLNYNGNLMWKKQFGTTNNDGVRGLYFDSKISDNILISGVMNLPPANGFIRMYKKDGNLIWERKIIPEGMKGDASGKDVSFDNKGNIYHLGLTGSNLFGSLIGEHDLYLLKLKVDSRYINK